VRLDSTGNFIVLEKEMSSVKDSMAAGHKMVHDANLGSLSDILGCQMAGAKEDMQKTLAMTTLTHPRMLIGRQQTILYLRSRSTEIASKWNARFARLAEIEKEISPFFQKDSKDKDSLEEDAIAQLSFQHEFFKPLNHVPMLLFVVSLFKIWIVPAASVLMPLIVWILPYILLRFVYALPITQDQYIHIVQHIMTGNLNIPEVLEPAVAAEPITARTIFQFLMFAFTFAQSMIQPIQNAMHLHKTDTICVNIGKKIIEVRKTLQEFRADLANHNGIHVKVSYSLEHLNPNDIRMAFISIQDCPENIKMVFRDVAHLECMWRIATSGMLNHVVFIKDVFKLDQCHDISITDVEPVKSTVELKDKKHVVLTGPNGGGKSSFLRSVLQSVLIGHAFGFAPAKEAYMPRFSWIASGLELRETPGKFSMFETEVRFASEALKMARQTEAHGPGLLLYDELFHSTNPIDSARSANQFLRRLWKKENVFTIVSTHLFPIITTAPKHVQALCCPATNENGEVKYSYEVQPGVCEVSSVHTVWEKFGLTAVKTSPAKSQ
jgi:hypothetical protein